MTCSGRKKCHCILSFFFSVIIKYLSVFKWFLFFYLLYQDISIFFFHKRFFFLTDTKKQHMRGWICWLLYCGSEMAIYFVGLIWLLSQCGGTEEIMFHCELLGQHGPSPLKEAWFRESSLLFSFRHECKTKWEFLHLLQIWHFLAPGKCCP